MSATTSTRPTMTAESRRPPVTPRLELPAPISLLPVVVAILFAVVTVWALAWLAWIP